MKLKIILISLSILIIGIIIFISSDKPQYVHFGEDNYYEISVGEKFSFLLSQNKSTGYEYCWLNNDECTIVHRTGSDYSVDDIMSDGGGGTAKWTFIGVEKGEAEIKLCKCPTMVQDKTCADYQLDDCSSSLIVRVMVK